MLGEVLSETRGFDTLLMSDNDMGDLSLVVLLDGLKRNEQLRLKHLDLSQNKLGMHVGMGVGRRRRGREGQWHLTVAAGLPPGPVAKQAGDACGWLGASRMERVARGGRGVWEGVRSSTQMATLTGLGLSQDGLEMHWVIRMWLVHVRDRGGQCACCAIN